MLVFCAGMPKAGSTLQYNLCKELLGDRVAIDYGWVPAARWAEGFKPSWGDTSHEHAVLKCHGLPPWIEEAASSSAVRIVSTYRDLRDVAASARDFQPEKDFDYLLATLSFTVEQLQRLEGLPNCLIQRYEAMIERPEATVRQLAEHLGCEPTAEQIGEMATRWEVKAVKERATKSRAPQRWSRHRWASVLRRRESQPEWDSETLLWPTHISSREGRPGGYEAVLARDEIDTIEGRFGQWLRQRAYQ
jgi:sulfotransferase family protein